MSAKPKLYLMLESPPCRFVVMISKILGVDLELVNVNLLEKENLDQKFASVSDLLSFVTGGFIFSYFLF